MVNLYSVAKEKSQSDNTIKAVFATLFRLLAFACVVNDKNDDTLVCAPRKEKRERPVKKAMRNAELPSPMGHAALCRRTRRCGRRDGLAQLALCVASPPAASAPSPFPD